MRGRQRQLEAAATATESRDLKYYCYLSNDKTVEHLAQPTRSVMMGTESIGDVLFSVERKGYVFQYFMW